MMSRPGRLGVLGAFNCLRTLNAIKQDNCDGQLETGNVSNSSTYSKLEKELKSLKMENTKLKSELDDLRVTLKQLISESSHEKFDERRINLLKFQLIQLERQIATLNEALGCRQESVLEVENTMTWLADKLRSYIAADAKGPVVPIARSDLTSMTEVLESARIKLFKALESSGKDSVGRDLILLNPFLGGKYKQCEPLSLLDISLQRMDYINLRHVAQLESKLCNLYKELIRVHDHMQNTKPKSVLAGHLNCAERDRMETVLLETCVMLKDSADDLMALSLLCPSSPWPILKRPLIKQVPIDRVITALPPLPRSKLKEVTHIIEASLHTCNHHHFLQTKEIAVLKEELAFHRSVYELQMQYTQALIDAVRKGYGEFEESAKSVICTPLKDILDAYKHLKNSASEDALRKLLIIVKANEEQLTSVVETFSSHNFETDESGSIAFSKFEEEFLGKINSLVKKCQTERDHALKAHKAVREEQTKKDLELQKLIEDLENKYEKTWTPKASKVPFSSETSSLWDKNNATNNKSRKHNDVQSENVTTESNHLLEGRDLRHEDTSSKLMTDLTVLRSFLDDDTGYTFTSENRNDNVKTGTDVSKGHISGCSVSAQDAINCSSHGNDRSKIRWKPDQEWIHDFSEPSKKADKLLPSAAELLEVNSKERTCKQIKDNSASRSQTATNPSSNEKPPIKSRKSEYKIKKPTSYDSKLCVASRTLKLRCPGSLPKPDGIECSGDSSLSMEGKADFELDKLSIQNRTSHSEHQLPNNEEESLSNEKHKLWR